MRSVKYSSSIPEENIALDELLLAGAESGEIGETLRFWESGETFVVLGRAGKTSEDCDIAKCRNDGIRILRRISGGGTVLQGPGCLNYSAVLSYERDTGLRNINASYRSILGAITEKIRKAGHDVAFEPISDLALSGRKVSGNAQARKRSFFLHHGTFLYDLDLDKIPRYLKHPSREPRYRSGRSHPDFVANISAAAGDIKKAVSDAFGSQGDEWSLSSDDLKGLEELVREKYSKDSWNYCF